MPVPTRYNLKMLMKSWCWVEWFLAACIAAVTVAVTLAIVAAVLDARESNKFQSDSLGKTYQTIVMELGTPTDREAFPDGVEVICWKKYHEATTNMVPSGKVLVPIHNPAHTSGWKAIMRNGVCQRMEKL